jgi:Fe-Mn family superoxide dismutase
MFTLPELGYEYNALEPHIDSATMEIHHTKHHATYVTKLNEALENYPEHKNKTIEELLGAANTLAADVQTAVRNNGGGHHNHSLFWESMAPGGSAMSAELNAKLASAFGAVENFQKQFSDNALNRFGSGWSWLVKSGDSLELYSTANQDSPLMEGKTPILGLDVWEHAYYLNYQNRRVDYITAWWNVVNWQAVENRLK